MVQSEAEPSGNRTHGGSSQYVEAMVPEVEIPGSGNENGETEWDVRQWKQERRWSGRFLRGRLVLRRLGGSLDQCLACLVILQRPSLRLMVC